MSALWKRDTLNENFENDREILNFTKNSVKKTGNWLKKVLKTM